MDGGNKVMELNYIDFEKVVFGWQQILRYFELGKGKQIVIDYDPDNPKIRMFFFAPAQDGVMRSETVGSIDRFDCERFALTLGKGLMRDFKVGKKQRITMDYDPQNKRASIEFQKGPAMRSIGSSGISAEIDC